MLSHRKSFGYFVHQLWPANLILPHNPKTIKAFEFGPDQPGWPEFFINFFFGMAV